MLLNRIRPVLDPILRIRQNDYRQGHSTLEQLIASRRILEGVKEKNLSAVITFIDFKKSFDSAHQGKMINILYAYGIPEKMV